MQPLYAGLLIKYILGHTIFLLCETCLARLPIVLFMEASIQFSQKRLEFFCWDNFFYYQIDAIFFFWQAGESYVKWVKKYGSCFKYHGLLNKPALIVADPKLIQHILVNKSYDFVKCKQIRGDFVRFAGQGLGNAEGHDHKRQRKIMNPAFTYRTIKVSAHIHIYFCLNII